MNKSERLLALLQLLRQFKRPVKAATLAEKLQVNQRTIYRDIEALRSQGADIAGEAGIGYELRGGYLLPPLMFNIEEIEALILGVRWVTNHGDKALSDAASQAITKIKTVIPKQHEPNISQNTLFTPLMSDRCDSENMANNAMLIRQAIREEKIVSIDYQDNNDNPSHRSIYPFALAFFDSVQVLAAWCTLRKDFRNFRVDRIQTIALNDQHYSPRKKVLFDKWKAHTCINPESI